MNAKVGMEEIIGKVPQLVKVSPTDEIQNLVRLALPGITLRHTPSPPPAVPFKMNNQYFLLNQTGPALGAGRAVAQHQPVHPAGDRRCAPGELLGDPAVTSAAQALANRLAVHRSGAAKTDLARTSGAGSAFLLSVIPHSQVARQASTAPAM